MSRTIDDQDIIEGFPFMGTEAHETPRNLVCRECMIPAVRLPLFAKIKWSELCCSTKDELKNAAISAMKPEDPKSKGPMTVLLYGASGTGKTELVRALGAEFVEGKIDVSAPRVTLIDFHCDYFKTKTFADSANEIVCSLPCSSSTCLFITLFFYRLKLCLM